MTLVNADTGEVIMPDAGTLTRFATPTGLNLPDGLDYEDWQTLGYVLSRIEHSVMWWIGDWWRYGERAYGEAAAQAAPTGYSLKTVQTAAWVADQYPESSRRREDLTWTHHREAASLDDADKVLAAAAENGWSSRELRREVKRRKAIKTTAKAQGEDGTDWSDTEPEDGLYSVVVIDPPWRYDNTATRGAAEDHYPTMSVAELTAIDIPANPAGSHLYLWVTNGFIKEGFDLMDAWGFAYKTTLTWCKPQIGMGNYFRNNTEHVLFGVAGSLPTLRNDVPTWFVADRTRHSAKPESFYDLVESCSPGPYLEMFARRRRMGWGSWGNEV